MNEEQAFLDELRDHPEDDVTRLVYADWLEERDDPRAAYLRAEVALARLDEREEGYTEAEQEMARLVDGVDEQWHERVGKRWDLVFLGFFVEHKILAVRSMREALGYRLADALVLVTSAPSVVWVGAIRSAAEEVRRRLMHLHPEAQILAAITPNTDPTKDYLYAIEETGLKCKPYRWQPST